jgi:hypothetical protein
VSIAKSHSFRKTTKYHVFSMCETLCKISGFPMCENQGTFFRLHVAKKHRKKILCYKMYKNLRFFLDEKVKFQPWIIKKKLKLDEESQNWMKIELK